MQYFPPVAYSLGNIILIGSEQLTLKIENLGFRGHIYKMWPSIKPHIRIEFRLVDPTSIRARSADSYGYFLFDQIRQVIIGAITRNGLHS